MKRRALLVAVFLFGFAAAGSAQIALLDSAATREFFARHYPDCSSSVFLGAEEYQRYFRGWEFVLNEMGLPYTIIHDEDLTAEGLEPYTVLILSNIASLSDAHAQAVHHWTIQGGHLLATFGTGYTDVTVDRREADQLARQKGGTFALHQLWHDPVSKLFGTPALGVGGVDVKVTRFAGPTAGLQSVPAGILPYGAEANLLIGRPPNRRDVLASLLIDGELTDYPAIISTRSGRGHTVYYAFAPEYIVSKEFEGTPLMPDLPVCPDGQDWSGRSEALRLLMRDTISFLLNLPQP